MERIYDPNSFRSSEHMAVKEYFEEYREVCNFNYVGTKCKRKSQYANDIKQAMGLNLSTEEFQELEELCSINKLTIEDEPVGMPAEVPEKLQTKTKLTEIYPINDNAKHLNVMMCRAVLDKKHNITEDFKFGSKRFLKTTVYSNKSKLYDIVPGATFIYTIIVYRPFSLIFGQRNSAEKLRFAYEIEALGTNTLAEVADTIVCIYNIGLYKEVENTDVDLSPLMNAKEHYPSQSIFIDDTFYNDTRSPNAIDYSQKIIEWASQKTIGKFKTGIMEDTMLESLTPRLGYPYVYMHQGNCEHMFTFSDARMIQPGDCLYSKKYPRMVSLSRTTNIICFICGSLHSQWIVLNCEKFPQEKVFLCTGCCNSYLFVDGKKVTNFQLYPYYDHELVTRHLGEHDLE